MTDPANGRVPDPDPDPDPTPDDTELIAYLDGELDPDAARSVEDRLAADPQARSKAESLKRTYDLLDFLPKPEPSPSFTNRTLERLPTVGGKSSQAAARTAPSGSAPVVLSPSGTGVVPYAPAAARGVGRWAAAVAVAAVVASGVGYLGTAAARTYLFPPPSGVDGIPISDLRAIENLPLYAGVDDLDFLRQLDARETFAEELSEPAPVPPVDARGGKPWAVDRQPLIVAFLALPPGRQQQIRTLDRQLHELPPGPDRDRVYRVLEAYAVWLDRLTDADRRAVLDAPTPAIRLDVVRGVREWQWQRSLPPTLQRRLNSLPTAEAKAAEIDKWKREETDRAGDWALARRHRDAIRANRTPWPFDDPDLRKQVQAFVQATLKPDAGVASRLTAFEREQLRAAQETAERQGYWLQYGLVVHRLSEAHSYLPEPVGRPPLVDVSGLPQPIEKRLKAGGLRKNLKPLEGKWPDFAVAVADEANRLRVPLPTPLGPCRPAEFAEPLREFLDRQLVPRLSPEERDGLRDLEGKWPEYPRRMVDLARRKDLSVPGVTLPGPPSQWEKNYRVARFWPAPGPAGE